MPLDTYESLDDVLNQATAEGMAPEKKLELIDFWKQGALKEAEIDFADPASSSEHQRFASFVDQQAKKAMLPLAQSVTENKLKSHFGEDNIARNRFVAELKQNGDKYLNYSPEFSSIARDIIQTGEKMPIPADQHPISSEVADPKGNKMADISVSYTQNGKPSYAKVILNKQQDGEVSIPGGDVIRYPDSFDAAQYAIDQKKVKMEEAKKAMDDAERLNLLDETIASAYYDADKAYTEAQAKDRRQLAAEGANLFAQNAVKEKIGANDPKYKDVGQGLLEGMWGHAKSALPQLWDSSRAGFLNVVSSAHDVLSATGIRPNDPVLKEFVGERLKDLTASQEATSRAETFSRLSVTEPKLAAALDATTGAIVQGAVQAAQFALMGETAGLSSAFLGGAGAKVMELTQKEQDLRDKGDIESADWIKEHKTWLANRAGAYEVVTEKLFPAHNPARAVQAVGPRAAMQEFGMGFLQESAEGGISATASAVDEYATGLTDYNQFLKAISEVPEQALLEGVGTLIPNGARAVALSFMKEKIQAKAQSVVPPPVPQSPSDGLEPRVVASAAMEAGASNVAEGKQQQEAVTKAVADVVDGQPGDSGDIDPITKKRAPRTRNMENYLMGIYDMALAEIKERGVMGTALPFTKNAQGQEINPEQTIYYAFHPDVPPDLVEQGFSKILEEQAKLDPAFAVLPVDEQAQLLKDVAFTSYPPFVAMRNKGVAVSDVVGRTVMLTNSQLLKKIENQEIDPATNYFYFERTADMDKTTASLMALIPANRMVGNTYGMATRTKADGTKVQSKANEQVLLKNSKGKIDTVTIGGRSLHPKENLAKLDDMLANPDITVETRGGTVLEGGTEVGEVTTRKVHGQFLSEKGQEALIKSLDEKYGKNNWVMKPDGQLQRVGLITPWVKGTRGGLNEARTRFNMDIPVMDGMMYIAQERVKPKAEYRVNIRVNKDKTLSIIPFGIHGGELNQKLSSHSPYVAQFDNSEKQTDEDSAYTYASWKALPNLTVSKTFRDRVVSLLEDLQATTNLTDSVDTFYGLDILEDASGFLKIVEMNAQDSEGASGGVTRFGSATNGMFSLMRKGYTPEAMAVYAAYQKAQGAEAAAERILDTAIRRLGGETQDIPNAEALYNQSVIFSDPTSVTETSAAEKASFTRLENEHKDGDTLTAEGVLSHLENDPTILDYFRSLAKALREAGKVNQNNGLNAKVRIAKNETSGGYYLRSSNRVTITKSAWNALHEIIHALTTHKIPKALSVYSHKSITGKKYLSLLEDYLSNGSDTYLKNVIRDYIAAVNGLGLNDSVFGNEVIRTGEDILLSGKQYHYGLTSLDEFMAEALTNSDFAQELSKIPADSSRYYLRRLLNSIMQWVKENILQQGSAKNLFDKSYSDMMMFIAIDEVPENKWESDAISGKNFNTVDEVLFSNRNASQDSTTLGDATTIRHSLLEAKFQAGTITPEETAEAQELVNEAAKRAGYNIGPVYHGAKDPLITTFNPRNVPARERGDSGRYGWDASYFSNKEEASGYGKGIISAFLKMKNPLVIPRGSDFYTELKAKGASDSDFARAREDSNSMENLVKKFGFDGVFEEAASYRKSERPIWAVYDSENIKSADPFTGVSLDQRFNEQSPNILFSDPTDRVKPQESIVRGERINRQFLNAEQNQALSVIDTNTKLGKPQLSDIVDKSVKQLSEAAQEQEFQLLKQEFPNAFDATTNDKWKGYTNLAEAEFKLIDWLVENPAEIKGQLSTSAPKVRQSTVRQRLVKQFTYYAKRTLEKVNAKTLTEFEQLTPSAYRQVNRALDYITNVVNPKDMTNREIRAFSLALKNFVNSDGAVIRGFAPIIDRLYQGQETDRIVNEKNRLKAEGIENPFGDPISDWRRNFLPISKTGVSMADWATEMLAIFNRPSTRKIFAAMMAPYRLGINKYKTAYSELRALYDAKFDVLGKTTTLEDFRIGLVSLVTQYEQSGQRDPLSQIQQVVKDVDTSIRRNESSPKHARKAAIERAAYNQIILPILPSIETGNLTYDQIIQFFETQLSNKEYDYLTAIREPGAQYFAQLNAINQLARGNPIQNWRNYVKRVQYSMGTEAMTARWQEKALDTADSILQPREGLKSKKPDGSGDDGVFSLNFRTSFDWQLQETAYELNTGVERIALFNFVNSQAFDRIMDDADVTAPRANRMRAQIGGVHANIKNRELKFGFLGGAALETTRFIMASKLVTLKAVANQLIPAMNMILNNPRMAIDVHAALMLNPTYRKNANEFLKLLNPDLSNRLENWDNLIERVQQKPQIKESGMAMDYLQSVTEKLMVGGAAIAKPTGRAIQAIANAPIQLTNGITEVLSAKNVFFTLYVQKLIDAGLVASADDFFSRPVTPYYENQLSETELEFDSYVLTPIQPEFRSEFSQRNSSGKIAANLLVNALARTATQQSIKSVTALRDLFFAGIEYAETGSPDSAAFLESAATEAYKQSLNIGLYYGIAYLFMKAMGSVAGAASFVVAAAMSGHPEDEEYWKRRLMNREKVEKDAQAQFTLQNAMSDLVYFGVPMPAFLQNNGARSLFSSMFKFLGMENRTSDEYDADLEVLRADRDKLKSVMDAKYRSSMPFDEATINQLNRSLEYNDYAIQKTEAQKKEWDTFIDNTISGFAKGVNSVESATQIPRKVEDFTPDFVMDYLFSKKEKDLEKRKAMDEARTSSAWWALSSYLNFSSPSQKAARAVLDEYSSDVISKKKSAYKQLEQSLRAIGQ